MSIHRQRTVAAILGAALVLVVAWWFDTDLLAAVLRTGGNTFDVTQTAFALPAGYLTVAAGVFSVALLARWADSRLVDVGYALVGAFFAFLFTLVWTVAVSKNGAPPVLPDPLASFLGQTLTATETGTLNAVALIGAAMLVVGIADLGLALRRRPTREAMVAPAPNAAAPMPIAPQDA
jgi:hypothetical protein